MSLGMHRVMVYMKDHDDIRYRYSSLLDNIILMWFLFRFDAILQMVVKHRSTKKLRRLKINKSNVSV